MVIYEPFILKTRQKGLYLRLEQSPDLPEYIQTDEGKLRQVLINLVGNAVKFTEQGGVVLKAQINDVEPERSLLLGLGGGPAKASTPSPAYALRFEVLDTGPGMTREEMAAIFEMFGQGNLGQRGQEGTGLGLAISRSFVQLLGSELEVESTVGQGTCFKFDILAEPAGPPAANPKGDRVVIGLEPGQPCYRILVVDDHQENRRLLVDLLEPLGFELAQARNGREALAIWANWQPHLIWMDIRMPVMDGYEATRQIRAKTRPAGGGPKAGDGVEASAGPPPKGSTPYIPNATIGSTKDEKIDPVIIAITASGYEEEGVAARQAGCDGFVRKPFREDELLALIGRHLELRYLYQAPPEPRQAGFDPASLPPELLARLETAAARLDHAQINALIEVVRGHSAGLADDLAALAREFRYDEMISLVQQRDLPGTISRP